MKPTAASRRFLIWLCRTPFPAGHTHTDPPRRSHKLEPRTGDLLVHIHE